MKKTIYLLLLLIVSVEVYSQEENQHYNNGQKLYDAGDFKAAINEYTKAIETYKGSIELTAYCNRGLAKFYIEDYKGALDDFNIYLRSVTNDPIGYMGRADTYLQLNEYALAIGDYNRVLKMNSDNIPAYIGRGKAQLMAENYESAIADFNKVIEKDPDDEAYSNRAFINFKLGNKQAALNDFNHISNKSDVIFLQIGELHAQMGHFREAAASFTESINLNPRNPDAFDLRASVKVELGAFQDAIEDYNKALKLNPKQWECYAELVMQTVDFKTIRQLSVATAKQ